MPGPQSVLQILDNDDLLDLREAIVTHVKRYKINAICRKLVATNAGGTSSTYEFDCSLGDLAEAMQLELGRRGLLSKLGLKPGCYRAQIKLH